MAHTASKKLKEIPSKETAWVRCRSPDGAEYVITSSPDRSVYNLYRLVDGGVERVAKDCSPVSFDKVIYGP